MSNIHRTILTEWLDRPLPQIIARDQSLDLAVIPNVKKATVITGFRRTGKTYLLFSAIGKLLVSASRKDVVYLNFEDERIPQQTDFLSRLLPEIHAFYSQKPKYLFLDELQNIPFWSKWLRRILDTEDIRLFVTGSSSKMSSFELPTELRGRSWEQTVYPLNFSEFLRFKKENSLSMETVLFEEYLLWGGLPEVVLSPPAKRQELLQLYFQTVVRKEITDRFKIRNTTALKTVLKLILNSTYLTVSKLYNNLKSLGLAVGKTTLNQYVSYAESSYFLSLLRYYSPSMKNQLQYPRKPYFIDNGFLTSLSTKFSNNYGRLLENLTYWKLFKENENVFYHRDEKSREVDFIVMKNGNVSSIYQVCYDISDRETYDREVNSLVRLGKKFHCESLFLLTRNTVPTPSGIILLSLPEFFGGLMSK